MSEARFRAFLGLPLPTTLRTHLAELQDRFRRTGLRASWVAPENFHITLQFLGNITHENLGTLDQALTEPLGKVSALQLGLDRVEAYPSSERVNGVWVGTRTLRGDMGAVVPLIRSAAREIGLKSEERAFHSHVTLFRLRRGRASHKGLHDALASANPPVSDDFWVDAVALWRSELRRGGAVYHCLKEYPLKCLPPTSSPL